MGFLFLKFARYFRNLTVQTSCFLPSLFALVTLVLLAPLMCTWVLWWQWHLWHIVVSRTVCGHSVMPMPNLFGENAANLHKSLAQKVLYPAELLSQFRVLY